MSTDFRALSARIREDLSQTLQGLAVETIEAHHADGPFDVAEAIGRRSESIHRQVLQTVASERQPIMDAVTVFMRWMNEGTIVRVLGAGRARLAASIPANRLAHGGARVYIQDDIIPMPHTIKGGGIIAASASGKTASVLSTLRTASESSDIEIVGIAAADAADFKSYCDIFIGLAPEPADAANPLRALADSEEYVISLLLDAMVVAAGKQAGFIDTLWRIGHENLGPTGPYDHRSRQL
jgi:D-arabinose 5-phosphate isomerase GutQ